MDRIIQFFTTNWQEKTIAFITALVIWLFLWTSLTDTTTIPNVPIRVVSMPSDKTIVGILPNGLLNRRITLTLTGAKGVIDELEPGDLEVVLDASMFERDDEILKISRKNLVSLNPNIDFSRSIEKIEHPEFVLKLSKLITGKIPITVLPPKGEPPVGYVFLDIWPQKLEQTMTGPEEQIAALESKGVELSLDFSQIPKVELDRIKSSRENFHDDEVSYFIPPSLKKIAVPFRNYTLEEINDPDAQNLHIDFLRKEMIPLERYLPVRLFYPFVTLDTLNPKTFPLNTEKTIQTKYDLPFLPMNLYLKDVSRLFMEVIRDNIVISIVATKDAEELPWGISVIAPHELENRYVNHLMTHYIEGKSSEPRHSRKREEHLRTRFRDFLANLTLYIAPDKKFDLVAKVVDNQVIVQTQQISVDAPR